VRPRSAGARHVGKADIFRCYKEVSAGGAAYKLWSEANKGAVRPSRPALVVLHVCQEAVLLLGRPELGDANDTKALAHGARKEALEENLGGLDFFVVLRAALHAGVPLCTSHRVCVLHCNANRRVKAARANGRADNRVPAHWAALAHPQPLLDAGSAEGVPAGNGARRNKRLLAHCARKLVVQRGNGRCACSCCGSVLWSLGFFSFLLSFSGLSRREL